MDDLFEATTMAARMLSALAPDPESAVNERARMWRVTWDHLGLDWPSNWDELSVEEKTRRLDAFEAVASGWEAV